MIREFLKGFFSPPRADFSRVAQPAPSYFRACIDARFGPDTGAAVLDLFDRLGLPAPREDNEFLEGTDGALVFLSRYGVVLRVEEDRPAGNWPGPHVDDSRWILQPLGVFRAGKAVVEICPGCHAASSGDHLDNLCQALRREGISFWDRQAANIGLLPSGAAVVIDRGAVQKLTQAAASVGEALAKAGKDGQKDPQAELYAPLRAALAAAGLEGPRPDPEKVRDFWRLCEAHVAKGTLVAGWTGSAGDCGGKALAACRSAACYAGRAGM